MKIIQRDELWDCDLWSFLDGRSGTERSGAVRGIPSFRRASNARVKRVGGGAEGCVSVGNGEDRCTATKDWLVGRRPSFAVSS